MVEQQLRRSQREHPTKSLQESPPPETPQRLKSSRKPKDPDYAYRPPHEEDDEPSSSAYISPRRNIQWKEDVKLEARQAVIDHSVHGLSCAICGCDNNDGISYNMAHVLDRSLAGNEELVSARHPCFASLTDVVSGSAPRTQLGVRAQDVLSTLTV